MRIDLRRHLSYANVAATGALVIGITGFAVAAGSGGTSVIKGCVAKKGGALRIATKCRSSERPISWNQQGPPGVAGANGSNGANGAAGTNGTNGQNGHDGQNGAPGTARAYGRIL